ncbi:carbon monoxide dehydrogenase subunit G [Cytobacillus oceanisediminis]|uniref:Carbon monoxide dehydrogenase subunit G n=1 Tax=Cytobacillus oceanisediminis TaxID=665099 RepID=A0A2V2ZTQ8_9BACI|nr:SRPBCC family protein [Cytobacillus oceanisediminis]PWW25862.1 carbon monoxide dehydrogenase subunit G [Cytobacillus oceanisediminis]
MPNCTHQAEVNVPIGSIWNFVSDIGNWAPLVPGYIAHEVLNDKESTWSFKSDMGILKKKIELKVDITSWQEPTKVTFNLTGLNEKFTGHGYFLAGKGKNNRNLMTGALDIKAEGMMAKVANSLLNTTLPEITAELTEAVAAKLEQEYKEHAGV